MTRQIGVTLGLVVLCAASSAVAHETVFGPLKFADDCSGPQKDYLEHVMSAARAAASSQEFADCVTAAVTDPKGTQTVEGKPIGPYRKCLHDPFFDETLAVQAEKAIAIMRSPNEVTMGCSGGDGNASAWLGKYGHPDPESLKWGEWLGQVLAASEAERPKLDAQSAGIMMHEISHTHGYTHGSNNPWPAASSCGYANAPDWNYQVNTMPYILGLCITDVLSRASPLP